MKKLLFLHGNRENNFHTCNLLSSLDFELQLATNISSFFDLTETFRPDIILCDMDLEEIDGYFILKLIRNNTQTENLPVLLLTDDFNYTDYRKIALYHLTDYIIYPTSKSELLSSLEHLFELNSLINERPIQLNEVISENESQRIALDLLIKLTLNRKIRSFKKNDIIYQESDSSVYVYYLIKGQVKCIQTDSYGKEFVSEIYLPNDFFGFMNILNDDNDFHDTTIAMENTEVALIPKEDYLQLIKTNIHFSQFVNSFLAKKIKEREKRMLHLAYSPVRERVAEALLYLTHDLRIQEKCNSIVIAREDLACIVGTAKESLIRMLSAMKSEGLIDTDGQRINIIDKPRLKTTAEGSFWL